MNLFEKIQSNPVDCEEDESDSVVEYSDTGESESDEEHHEAPLKLSNDSAAEEINAFRNRLQIKVSGSKVPVPLVKFQDSAVPEDTLPALLRNIEASDWKEPTPIQMQAIPVLTGGRDLLACAPTVSDVGGDNDEHNVN